MKADIEIAQSANMKPIREIAAAAGIDEKYLEQYGNYKAKVDLKQMEQFKPNGKLILVTAITPTPAGEGKTTTSIGLADGLHKIGKNVMAALREPSLGPVFGIKGGAAGGGYAQVVPMEDINLHFTGDFHAIGAANNLLAAMLDNHIFQGNELDIDRENITWKRCVDMNDRQLRYIEDGLGGGKNGLPRRDGFDITVASEIMAVLCLASDMADLKRRLANIIVAYNTKGEPITARMLKAEGAMAALLKDAIKPNLVQTLEGTPALVHGGPFANIAHGCNSVIATKMALKLADYVVTEAGFGADLGAEKFLDIKCRAAGLKPDSVVVVATVRALKMHGGADKENLKTENIEALKRGIPNLLRHVSNITSVYGLPCVVAINRFRKDSDEEIAFIENECRKLGVNVCASTVWEFGGEGVRKYDLARWNKYGEVISRLYQTEKDWGLAANGQYVAGLDSVPSNIYYHLVDNAETGHKVLEFRGINEYGDGVNQPRGWSTLAFASTWYALNSETQAYDFIDAIYYSFRGYIGKGNEHPTAPLRYLMPYPSKVITDHRGNIQQQYGY